MARVIAGLLVILCASTAIADAVDRNIKQLATESSYKVRLAAALALSKSKDARAVLAVSDALSHDEDPTVRRVAALALEKMIDVHTPEDAKQLGLGALEGAASNDADERVRGTAATTLRALASVKTRTKPVNLHGEAPPVFVNIDATIDQSRKAPIDASDRVTRVVKQSIEKTGYATSWTGGLPTQADLAQASTRAFIVAATVKKIDVSRVGHQMEIACTVAIRIAPWAGKDGGEKWEANKAASATGSAKAMTGASDREVSGGMRDCLEAVSEDVTARQVLPFLRQLALAGS
ncbi:MAG TPA: HEAT repeat domain-containing protein [Kofleriaceae bacterium]|jgi:hypothetical protein